MLKSENIKPGFYYGWVIVACCFVAIFMATSSRYCFSIFMKPLSENYGFSRAQLGGAMSLNNILYALLSPVVGILLDRVGARIILLIGGVLMGLGLWLFASTQSLFGLYLTFGTLTGVGLAFTYFVPTFSLTRKWFQQKAGLASGIVAFGSGLGLAVIAPVTNYLVQAFSWQTGARIIGIFTWILVVPLAVLFIRNSPEAIGLHPDGINREGNPPPAPDPHPPLSELLPFFLSRNFILLFIFYFAWSLAVCGVLTHFFLWGTKDLKLDGGLVALALSLATLCASGSRLLGGWLSDRWGRLPFIALALFGLALAMIFGIYTQSRAEFYGFAVIFGIAYGLPLAVFPVFIGDLFGRRLTGSLYGGLIMAGGLAGGLGAWSFGFAFDRLGSYHSVYLITSAFCLFALFLMIFFRRGQSAPPPEKKQIC
ncbi:MAG: MFS transporter [Proteobacteria bacterium]|nr:MFS transporter [Pseudomonadota bacterium]